MNLNQAPRLSLPRLIAFTMVLIWIATQRHQREHDFNICVPISFEVETGSSVTRANCFTRYLVL